jgi:hypothetical protein
MRVGGRPRAVEVKAVQAGRLVTGATESQFAQEVERLWVDSCGFARTWPFATTSIAPVATLAAVSTNYDFVYPLSTSVAVRLPLKWQRDFDALDVEAIIAGGYDMPGNVMARLVIDKLSTFTGSPFYSEWVPLATPATHPAAPWSAATEAQRLYHCQWRMGLPGTLPANRACTIGFQAGWDPVSSRSVFSTSPEFKLRIVSVFAANSILQVGA